MKKDNVLYPVVLKPDNQFIFVRVPDLEGGYTQGNDTFDAIEMAEDLIGNLLENTTSYPKPSEPSDISLKKDEKLVYVTVDLAAFRRKFSKTIRRNVTIPEYLNHMANDEKINVSQVLTEALEEKLGV
ncbi:antitoxin HicB [Secundilactobacillus paracollinoides]|uniref:Antitoxin HicB n=1 Tax=Secundilactobacillus paracollinoides TaxID=240427 RepID=A0A1B2IYQ9_9LACO|nr:type II toxin-antitoxin system HicB family antitoxin [Secundilactobacillus paracollinoides]ANZ61292.1 antitoxin HicB [Secundilactobacillus paracollinoides]ANZ64317.1 antitoxin HicB [Secundilactobacillus paracollinoides]ANZ67214.1 antitoxin HicB [Secundilactobacillus paracollinoides]KRL75337.1 toxin-antitoxin system, antitoxin component, HicB family [Secundilactobacillus paracollinoides DSM 15502 = JCM 11969]